MEVKECTGKGAAGWREGGKVGRKEGRKEGGGKGRKDRERKKGF